MSVQAHSMSRTFLGVPDVPQLGIGLAALGRPGYINLGHGSDLASKSVEDMRQHCWQVLDEAHKLGIRYYDAARSYGRAEEFLSGWLSSRGLGREQAVVGSKWGYYYTADWKVDTGGAPHEVKEHTAPRLASQQAETDALLGSTLRLYQIHSATLDSGVLQAKDVLQGLERLKADKGWRIGLSLSGVAQAETLRQALTVRMSDGRLLFDSVQATWNLLEQSAGDALLEAHQAGLDVIVKEGMANGRLAPRNSDPGFAAKRALMEQAAAKYGVGVDALALAAVMVQPFAPMVLSGASTVEQIRSNARALEVAPALREPGGSADMAALMSGLRQDPGEYWAQRSSLAWN